MRILLAVSGGIDSMYLAENASKLIPDGDFAVAHCNFKLRGHESDGDQAFVAEWCRVHSVPFHTVCFETEQYAIQKGISIEMAARELRYNWFAELCDTEAFAATAVAHNANDNAETLILNVLRGTGSKGLRGMEAEGYIPAPAFPGKRLLRPMLGISRNEIRQWMEENGKEWREDSSNSHNTYKRNRIRNEVFPIFEGLNPSFLDTLRRDMQNFAQVDDIAEDYFQTCKELLLKDGKVSISGLTREKHWKYLLFRLTEPYCLNNAQLTDMYGAIMSGRHSGGRRFGELIITNGSILFPVGNVLRKVSIERIALGDDFNPKMPAGILAIDADKFTDRPEIRPWRNGDWFIPYGMKGRKKLSDFFSNLKLSPDEKKNVRVISYPGTDDRVAAVVGMRIDDSMKVTAKTKNAFIVKFD